MGRGNSYYDSLVLLEMVKKQISNYLLICIKKLIYFNITILTSDHL